MPAAVGGALRGRWRGDRGRRRLRAGARRSAEHHRLGQAPDRPLAGRHRPRHRALCMDPDGAERGGRGHARRAEEPGRDRRRGAAHAQEPRRGLAGRRAGGCGDHRAGLFRRRPAPGHERRRAARRHHRAATAQRAHRGGGGLRPGYRERRRQRRRLRGLRPRRRHLRRLDPAARARRVRGAVDQRRRDAGRRRFRHLPGALVLQPGPAVRMERARCRRPARRGAQRQGGHEQPGRSDDALPAPRRRHADRAADARGLRGADAGAGGAHDRAGQARAA